MTRGQLNIPCSTSIVRVRIVDTSCSFTIKAESFIKPLGQVQDFFEVPDLAFLIEHEVSGQKVMFDLGIRKDYWNLPAVVLSRLGGGNSIPSLRVEKDVPEVLMENGIELGQISAVVWSHYHWDHIGDVSLFPPSTSLVVGPGFTASPTLMPGYPNNPISPVPADCFTDRELRELDFSSQELTIGGFRAIDFFLDGSFYLLDTPGHCIGHICGLARTTPEPESTFIFLGGDICHSASCFRPSPDYPLPDPLPKGTLDQDNSLPMPCPASIFTDRHPQATTLEHPSFNPRTTPFHEISTISTSAYNEPRIAQRSVNQLIKFDGSPSILVCFTHDQSLTTYLPTISSRPDMDLNKWKSSGWKESCHWDWLNLLSRAGFPGREPVVYGYWRDGEEWEDAKQHLLSLSGNVEGSGL
ncbi:beta-lactamase-like protein [Bisporella sp. PMI_857]|nr:beta-lactamase-like protein [Bisporella sp. PMI_857]